jgi:hypothetical protein
MITLAPSWAWVVAANPTLLATIADVADPPWRGSAIRVYRL